MRRSRSVRIILLSAAIWIFQALVPAWQGAAPASVISWNNAAGGNWSNAMDWSPNQVPGALDDALITLDGTYTVTLDVDACEPWKLGDETGEPPLAGTLDQAISPAVGWSLISPKEIT